MSILDELAAHARERVLADSENMSLDILQAMCREKGRANGARFYDALKKDDLSFICEVKRASPSKGLISPDFPYLDIARKYESIGASAISVLTEPKHFRGEDRFLEEIADTVDVPVLRKDFIIDEYQIHRAREIGASAVLLIASVLSDRQLGDYRELAESLGMSALVEAHTADEVERAVSSGAGIIGVNNRDLATFDVDLGNSLRLRERIPEGIVCVSESGISGAEDVRLLRDAGFDAVLVGEAFMRSPDRRALMEAMRS